MSSAAASRAVFERLFDEAVPRLLDGTHYRDEPPLDGGRWPVSVVCLPDSRVRAHLSGLLDEARVHTGPGHFETGREDASHFTVRALEPYREAARASDTVTAEWIAALDTVARETAPIRLRLSGVTLSNSCIMARALPVDDAPWQLMRRLRAVLGPLAWFEDQWQERDIWYASVLHFAAPLLDASGLIDWARSRQDVPAFDVVLDTLSLVRARYREDDAGRRMVMEPWHTAELTALPTAQLAAVFSALDAACAGGVFSRRCWV
jgi:hypothetical protein